MNARMWLAMALVSAGALAQPASAQMVGDFDRDAATLQQTLAAGRGGASDVPPPGALRQVLLPEDAESFLKPVAGAMSFRQTATFRPHRYFRYPIARLNRWSGMFADATATPDGKILFAHFGNGMMSADIYELSPDGAIVQRSRNARWNTYPVISGDWIYFTSYRKGRWATIVEGEQTAAIYRVRRGGEDEAAAELVADSPGKDWDPAVHDGGRWLLYTNGAFDPTPGAEHPTSLRCHDLTTGKAGFVLDDGTPNIHPRAVPGTDSFVFSSKKGARFQLYSLDCGSGEVVQLTNLGTENIKPAVSADGKWIAFKGVIVETREEEVYDPDAASKGQNPFVRRKMTRGNPDIYMMAADGSGETVRLSWAGSEESEPFFMPDGLLGFKSFMECAQTGGADDEDPKRVLFSDETRCMDYAEHFLMDVSGLMGSGRNGRFAGGSATAPRSWSGSAKTALSSWSPD